MKKKFLNLIVILTLTNMFWFAGCGPSERKPMKKLSAGETEKPNSNYSVANKDDVGYEEPHNTRVDDPYFKLKPSLTPEIPAQVKPHSRLLLTDVEDRTFFDYFAWQTFVGLVWPVDKNFRGVADAKVTAENFAEYNTNNAEENRRAVVWESFQTFDKALPNPPADGPPPEQPTAWDHDQYKRPFKLDLFSKGGHTSEFNEAFSSPLIDQNRQYVRYNLQMNKVMYEFIRQNKWYLKGNLPKAPTQATIPPLPVDASGKIISQQQMQTNTIIKQPVNGNSITIKTAWRVMITESDSTKPWREIDDLSRYFISTADISDAVTGKIIKNQKVGLVGIHIVVKTPQFTQGIWSSFEHIDNVKAPKGIRPSFNRNGDDIVNGYSYTPNPINSPKDAMLEKNRQPVEVSRIYDIPKTPLGKSPTLPDGLSTQALNKTYQKLLKGTVWENYELVITQWPTDPTTFYAKPFFYPRGYPFPTTIDSTTMSIPAIKAYQRAQANASAAYPRWSGLPIPQVGCLNTTMETYFQSPVLENVSIEESSCMGCHYGASDMDYVWGLKHRTWPQPFNQGIINPKNDSLIRSSAVIDNDFLISTGALKKWMKDQ